MNEDELSELLRATLREHAEHASNPHDLADRTLARIEGLDVAEVQPVDADVVEWNPRRQHGNRWRGGRINAVIAAAASVAAVVTLSVVVAKHGGSSSSSASVSKVAAQDVFPSRAAGAETDAAAAPPKGAAASSTSTASFPSGFRITDLSYYTHDAGYALGTAACAAEATPTTTADSTAAGRSTTCTTLIRTSGTGRDLRWSLASAALPFSVASIDHLRFATAAVGYAYGSAGVYATVDAGITWTKQLPSADALEVATGFVVAVAHPTTCDAGQACTYTVSVADTATDDWSAVTLPGGPLVGTSVDLARTGDNVYLVVRTATGADERFFASADDGRIWTQRSSDLCPAEKNGAQSSVLALASASVGGPAVSALCTSSSGTFLYTSTDAGATFTVGAASLAGANAMVMTSPTTTLLSADRLYRSVNSGNSYTPTTSGPDPTGGTPRFLGFESALVGRWVSPDGSTVWTTTDAGATWTSYSFR